jgi:predicted alpha/beta-fold hydrolase
MKLFIDSGNIKDIQALVPLGIIDGITTVDLLGKTDQTDYYRNDSNCFKDPTCIFFSALGSFIN